MKENKNAEQSVIRFVAKAAPWLAPLPSAWFVGRSIYLHLLLMWAPTVNIPNWINVIVAIIAGLTVETLAMVSIHNALALFRWNNLGNVKKDEGHWERAPFGLAVICTVLYVCAAILLLFVLETMPEAATWAPLIFPAMTVVAATNLGILDQHLSRLDKYHMNWNLSVKKDEPEDEQSEQEPNVQEQIVEQLALPFEPDEFDLNILQTFKERPTASYQTVADVLNEKKSTVYGRAKQMEQAGALSRTDNGMVVLWSGNGRK